MAKCTVCHFLGELLIKKKIWSPLDRTEEQTGRSTINYRQDKERAKPWSKMRKLSQNFSSFFPLFSNWIFIPKKGSKGRLFPHIWQIVPVQVTYQEKHWHPFITQLKATSACPKPPKVVCKSLTVWGLTFCFHCLKKVRARFTVCF